MTAFWNFVAIGHSPPFLVEKKNFSQLLPGFRLFVLEPAADMNESDLPASNVIVQDENSVGDLRQHLTQLFFTHSLPFQKVIIHPADDEPNQ